MPQGVLSGKVPLNSVNVVAATAQLSAAAVMNKTTAALSVVKRRITCLARSRTSRPNSCVVIALLPLIEALERLNSSNVRDQVTCVIPRYDAKRQQRSQAITLRF
jgi:hypothetical protein